MPTYEVKSRTTGPTTLSTVDAPTSQDAIHATVAAAEEGHTVEVMQVTEMPVEAAPQSKKEK